MKLLRYMCLAVGVLFATSAMALTPKTTYMVKLSIVSPTGHLTQTAATSGMSDANGKISFTFSNIPTNNTARFLMVQIIDGNGAVVRQSMVAAPATGSNVRMGVNELTDKQAKAMHKTIADAGSDNPMLAMLLTTMVRSGALSDADAQNFSPLARGAASAMETFMTGSGVTATQIAAFKSNMLTAMGTMAAKYKESVDAETTTLAVGKQGEAVSGFMDDMIKAAADAGIPVDMMSAAFDEAGKAAETAAASSSMNSDIIMGMKAAFQVDAQQRQMKAEIRQYTDAMSSIGASAAHMQQFATASTALSNAMMTARTNFEQMFTDSSILPDAATISAAESAMLAAMQTAFNSFLSNDAAASNSDITDMLNVMAARMNGMGGKMSGMTSTTLTNMSIGKMMAAPGGMLQNWTIMMVSVNDFITPQTALTYTPSVALPGQLTALGAALPTPPEFTQFIDPYQSLLELQYDLMLLRLIDVKKLSQLGATPTQAQLAQLKEEDVAARTAIKENIGGITDAQKDALLILLAMPMMM